MMKKNGFLKGKGFFGKDTKATLTYQSGPNVGATHTIEENDICRNWYRHKSYRKKETMNTKDSSKIDKKNAAPWYGTDVICEKRRKIGQWFSSGKGPCTCERLLESCDWCGVQPTVRASNCRSTLGGVGRGTYHDCAGKEIK